MRKSITDNWQTLRQEFIKCQRTSSGVVQIASVDSQGNPNMTPIGSLFLGDEKKAFFCNRFPANLNQNIKTNNQVCVIAMNSSKRFWFTSLFKGKFSGQPGIKLYGRVSAKRPIRPEEKQRWEKMVKPFRYFKGYTLLWKNMDHVSDIVFDAYEYLNTGEMAVTNG